MNRQSPGKNSNARHVKKSSKKAAIKRKRRVWISLLLCSSVTLVWSVMGITYAQVQPDADRSVDLGNILSPVVTPKPTAAPVLATALTPEPEPDLASAPDPAVTPGQTAEPKLFGIPGNMTVMNDISQTQAADKEFLTVTTRSGAIFYIIIDKSTDNENVHFLNQVDEADLQSLLADKDTTASITPTPTMTPEPTPTPEATPEPEKKKSGAGGVIFVGILLAVLGGGAYYYFKVLKPKQHAAKTPANNEYDELDFEDENESESSESESGGDRGADYGGIRSEIPEFEPFSEPSPSRGSGRKKPGRSAEDDFSIDDFDKMSD